MWGRDQEYNQIDTSLRFPQVDRALPDEYAAQVLLLMYLSTALNVVLFPDPQHTYGFRVTLSSTKFPTNRCHNKLLESCRLQFSIRSQTGREMGRERYRVELLQDILLEF